MDDTDPERGSVTHKYNTHGGDSVTKILGKNILVFPLILKKRLQVVWKISVKILQLLLYHKASAECPLNFAWP